MEYSQGVSACQLERHRKVDSWWHKVAAAIWPPHCVLCEGIGANGRDLCVPCEHDLPLNTASCRVCAQPLALGRADPLDPVQPGGGPAPSKQSAVVVSARVCSWMRASFLTGTPIRSIGSFNV